MKDKIFIGVVVIIISTTVGYFLNDYLSRDNLSIEHLEIVPTLKKHTINKTLLTDIITSTEERYFSDEGLNLRNIPDDISQNQVERLKKTMRLRKSNTTGFVNRANRYLEKAKKINSSEDAYKLNEEIRWELLRRYNPIPRSSSIVLDESGKIIVGEGVNKQDIISILNSAIERASNHIKLIDKFYSDLLNYKKERTGEFEIIVTLLNSGDTDGLIKKNGVLYANNYSKEIPIKLSNKVFDLESSFLLAEYISMFDMLGSTMETAIKQRSIVELNFKINEDDGSTKIIEELKELVRTKNPLDYSIRLNDFRGDSINSKKYKLYVTD